MWKTYTNNEGTFFNLMKGQLALMIYRDAKRNYFLTCTLFCIINKPFAALDDAAAKKLACEICISEAAKITDILIEAKEFGHA